MAYDPRDAGKASNLRLWAALDPAFFDPDFKDALASFAEAKVAAQGQFSGPKLLPRLLLKGPPNLTNSATYPFLK